MSKIVENALIVDNPIDLEREIHRYNCHTREELEEVLYNEYDAVLIINF